MPSRFFILVWVAATLGLAAYLVFQITGGNRSLFLPGETSDGHHQIELACAACHTPFGGVRQDACLECHEAELEAARDSHAGRKFTDPRNVGDLSRLDVRLCITCHVEHRPEITEAMGLTVPVDFCRNCHADVGVERPTHRDMSFDTCASAGCHNYHDNRSLYEDFLLQHGKSQSEPVPLALPRRKAWISGQAVERLPLTAADADLTASATLELIDAWAGSAHAGAGVACSDCHQSRGSFWSDHPTDRVCNSCHELEPQGFLAGKHGMRRAVGFDAMTPSQARLPMQLDSMSRALNCGACHDVHAANVRHAAVEACLSCHADEHSLAYSDSPHFRLWQAELSGEGQPGSGVSCASCHLPRERRRIAGDDRIVVQHNQNANLRPNEKMIRDVCLTCHSLVLAIDAMADADLIRRNFVGLPSHHVPSIDMALSGKD